MTPKVYGHGTEADINTLPSFDRVRAAGADGVELDVRRTTDDQLAVIHDPIEDLRPDVPTLAQALDACRGLTVNIEIKNFPRDPAFDPAQRVTELVCELLAGRTDDALISCFDFACIDLAKGSVPTAMLYLSRRPAPDLLDAVVEHGHLVVHPYDTMVDEAFMDEARARDLAVNVWLDAGAERMSELMALGVDGLITSDVAAAVRLRNGS